MTDTQEHLLRYLKQAALELGESGHELTSLIGELSACKFLNLRWEPSKGYDAIGSNNERYQIKTRRARGTEEVQGKHRTGKFGKRGIYDFEQGIYVELNNEFEIRKIWQLSKDEIIPLENKEVHSSGMHVRTFRQAGTVVYSK